MNKALLKNRKQDGFTIIEVLIVLAIAALILVVVLVAVPQLQQSQRNSARQAVANRIVAELNNYAGNNNGEFPEPLLTADRRNFGTPAVENSFFGRYFDCDNTTPPAACDINIDDPQTGVPVGIAPLSGTVLPDTTAVNAAGLPASAAETPGTNAPQEAAGSIHYVTGAVCDGELVTDDNAVPRNFSFQIRLEGGAIYCLDNR